LKPIRQVVFSERQFSSHLLEIPFFSYRWEVPDVVVSPKSEVDSGFYVFSWTENPFGFAVQRLEDRTLFQTKSSSTLHVTKK
jgi:hypothetical protein